MSSNRNTVFLTIESDLIESPQDAVDRIHGWLETYGHTAPSHGFEFKSVTSSITGGRTVETKNAR
jgi:hypothetical protein